MKNKIKNIKFYFINAVFILVLSAASLFNTVSAECSPGVVPNPIDPNCEGADPITAGQLINRILGFLPIVVTFAAVAAIIRASFKVMMADDVEQRQEGFKNIINAALGVGIFYSIWLILFILEYFTKTKIIYFGA
jgi:hypothetical protein